MQIRQVARVVTIAGLLGTLPIAIAPVMAQPSLAGSVSSEIANIKKQLADLQTAAANVPTLSQALQELTVQVQAMEQKLATATLGAENTPRLVTEVDALGLEIGKLRTELEYLRTNVANIEQPSVSSTSPSNYTIGGYMHSRYEMNGVDSIDSSGFRLRRGRVVLKGKLSSRIKYKLGASLIKSSAPLLSYYVDLRHNDALNIRIGQDKIPYTRSFMTSSKRRMFAELSQTQNRQRYDRDIGVWALGKVMDGKLRYHGGISNGSGRNKKNDNIDLVGALRVEGVLLGKYFTREYGDVKHTAKPTLVVGAGLVHDLVAMPDELGGVEVGNRDVDNDGAIDNVRVVSSTVDAQFRYKGFDFAVEGTWRHERWGKILQHSDNNNVADQVQASNRGRRNYLGATVETSYFVMPKVLTVGARLSRGRLPLLGLAGRTLSPVLTQRAVQLDGIVQFYREGLRMAGLTYSMRSYEKDKDEDSTADLAHTLVAELQLAF